MSKFLDELTAQPDAHGIGAFKGCWAQTDFDRWSADCEKETVYNIGLCEKHGPMYLPDKIEP